MLNFHCHLEAWFFFTLAIHPLFAALASQRHEMEHPNLVWIDLEMTGLDVEKDVILEIACIVTDSYLDIVAEGPDIIIHQPESVLQQMNEWCTNQHAESGLTEASLKSTVDLAKAEQSVLNFLKKHTEIGKSPLAGNSVYMDRIFMQKHMPNLNSYLNYRIIDVSTVKELCSRWYPQIYKNIPIKTFQHRSLADIRESIIEMRYYYSKIFAKI